MPCRVGLWLCAEVSCPLTPDPSPPFRGRGEEFVFFELHWKARMAALAPGRGEGLGVRGEDPWKLLCRATDEHGCGVFFLPRMNTDFHG